ncbi:hypothetical protein Leryth_019580 [Lithospermum erythrorhizon]|nr:hypothetical protein Leryth_019580 [Lithospermum erythrorhizon]
MNMKLRKSGRLHKFHLMDSVCAHKKESSSEKYAPLDWVGYFDEEEDVSIPESTDVFHVYKAGNEGPVVFCLHGGGYTGLSFALSANIIKEKARVVAMDLRGHGKSATDNELDLSIETMCSDVLAVLKAIYGDSPPAIVLVGHRYEGLSDKFLSSPVPKILLLAGTDRLDRTLTIGQMQGKFQMVLVRHTGHAIQEDVPDEFASLILNFISRNKIGPHGVEIPGLHKPSEPKA